MEYKELLNRISIPVKPKINEDELIKAEENNISEVIQNVKILFKILLVFSKKYKFYSSWIRYKG